MKKIILSVIVLLLVEACQTINQHSKDMNAIRRWIMNYEEAIRKTDSEHLLSFVSDDVVYLPPNQPSFSGKENLRKWFLEYFNYYSPSENLHIRTLGVNGDCAFLICDYSISARENNSGKEFHDNGKLINLFKRSFNGEWKITYSIWNSNTRIYDLHSQIPADFSGTWKLDLNRSTIMQNIFSSTIVIVQKGNDISINRTHEIKDKKPLISSFNYKIGSEVKNNSKTESSNISSFWSIDKQSFTVIETLLSVKNGTKQEYKRTTVYSITAKGETLSVISDDILPEGSLTQMNDRHIEMIFNKL
ncbi:MAG: DUF4440 domain-containing protein [Bacteroidia bacterium]|nr:DUF4440 domain-containing protein [Bacteroidia bacterium]